MGPVRLTQLGLIIAMLGGCASPTGESQGPPVLLTALPRALSGPEALLINANNQFGFDLFQEIRRTGAAGNIFVSPLSATMALGMTLNGAAGTTLDSMRLALRFGNASLADINAGYRSLINLLVGLDPTSQFSIANSIWTRQGFTFLPAFLTAGQTWFDAEVQALDFGSPQALGTINGWVSDKTKGKIPKILDQIDPDEVMFLINAIYFKGSWRLAFDPKDTGDAPFHAGDGTTQSVKTMTLPSRTHRYASTPDAEIVELLYGNGAFAMTIVLPREHRSLADLTAGLTTARWAEWTGALADRSIPLTFPKFKVEYSRTMKDDLTALGMGVAFTERADLSGMAGQPGDLLITRVIQKTFVDVNEEGTEAAAATVVGVGVTSAPMVLQINRPFLFSIRERLSGTIFFLGQIQRVP
jgi:serpin B